MSDHPQMLQKYEPQAGAVARPMTADEIYGQVQLIQQVMKKVMQEDTHYGKIPGCGDKPTLLQPGAQTLMVTFRLGPKYDVDERQLERGHREYRVSCTLTSIVTGNFVGQGFGTCSTLEAKYRFRVAPRESTGKPVPGQYWSLRKSDPEKAQELLGGPGFSTMKVDNVWVIAEGSGEKVEHDNPADYYNTCLKMACKRALVAATLTATAASDIFTQDLEDIADNAKVSKAPAEAKTTAAPQSQTSTPASSQTQTTNKAPSGGGGQPALSPATNRCQIADVREATSKPDSKRPWKATFATFIFPDLSTFEAGTFDTNLGAAIHKANTEPKPVLLVEVKPGKRENTLEIVSLEEDDIPM